MTRRAFALLISAVLLAGRLAADTIRLTDGTSIANVDVVSEGLKEVAYKEGRTDKTVPSEQVAGVDYAKKPQQLLDAEGFLLNEDLPAAVDMLDAYVKAVEEKPALASQFKWAPAWAAWRAIEVRMSVLDWDGVRNAAGHFLQQHPEARAAPRAYLAKAEAEHHLGQGPQALKTLGEFQGLSSAQGLSKR